MAAIPNYLTQFFTQGQRPIAAARSPDGLTSIYYALNLKPMLINMRPFTALTNVFWFDPTSGTKTQANNSAISNSGEFIFTPWLQLSE